MFDLFIGSGKIRCGEHRPAGRLQCGRELCAGPGLGEDPAEAGRVHLAHTRSHGHHGYQHARSIRQVSVPSPSASTCSFPRRGGGQLGRTPLPLPLGRLRPSFWALSSTPHPVGTGTMIKKNQLFKSETNKHRKAKARTREPAQCYRPEKVETNYRYRYSL